MLIKKSVVVEVELLFVALIRNLYVPSVVLDTLSVIRSHVIIFSDC